VSHNLPDRELDNRQLRHDFANDIGSLKMNVEAIRCVRENPEEFGQLIELMRETISILETRITQNWDAMTNSTLNAMNDGPTQDRSSEMLLEQ
jgi:hypothetical protein